MKVNFDKLKEIARPMSPEALAALDYRVENADWLLLSAAISLKIRKILSYKGMSQADLAELLSVTPAQVSKLLSGKANFEIKTIAKLQSILGIPIIEVDLISKITEDPEKDSHKPSFKDPFSIKNNNGDSNNDEKQSVLMEYQMR